MLEYNLSRQKTNK